MLEPTTMAASGLNQYEFGSAVEAAGALAQAIAQHLQAAIAARGRASLVVSGGRSPVPLFEALRRCPLAWDRVWVTLADERWVEPTSSASNEKLLRDHLLLGAAAAAHFVGLKSAHVQPGQALDDRSVALDALPRPYDVVVLGMGDDGHIASLFPEAEGLVAALDPQGSARLAAIVPPAAPHPRISQTLAALLDARQIFLLLAGAEKRARFAEALAGAAPTDLPIAAVLGQSRVPVAVYWSAP